MELQKCVCGGEAELIKLRPKSDSCFFRCKECGREGRAYTSKQNAIKGWNAGRYEVIPDEDDSAFSDLMQDFAQKRGEELLQLNVQLQNDPACEVPEELRRRTLEIIRGIKE